ncbi:hypothetical protein FBD94_07125 [Pedobacter hiemivivus]|uniref:Uncharacterized protein n=1 Tax=Pedobacter hiemivivus TaxID=2530454 RepID=A0A4U1GM45_9SPHI|nr:hypothetical protein [Pedobacter hiemivivus]TKC64103.1 hypothetical protein FBD94_07125 [Pedobacter hiemivivus]
MARINNGILGGMHSNADPVEGYVKYGVAHLREKKRKRTTPQPQEKEFKTIMFRACSYRVGETY